jgi:hypothetical protein
MNDLATTTVAWAATLFGLIGVFISILVTIMISQQSTMRKQLTEIFHKLDDKMDRVDHEKQSAFCVESIRNAFGSTFQRIDEKVISVDKKFCGHSHTTEGHIIIGSIR